MAPPNQRRVSRRLFAAVLILAVGIGLQRMRRSGADRVLVDLVRHNDVTGVDAVLRRGGSVDARTTAGWTLLMEAAGDGSNEVVDYLLRHGAAANAADSRGWTALLLAILHGHEDSAALLLAHGAQVNQPNRDRETPLMLAARAGSEPLARLLLRHGANRRARDLQGETAAWEAVHKGFPHLARLLTDAEDPDRSHSGLHCYICNADLLGTAAKLPGWLFPIGIGEPLCVRL